MKVFSRLTAIAVIAGVVIASAGTALAALGHPVPWQMDLQDSATPVMDEISEFHYFLLWVIGVISVFVLALLLIIIVRFNARANPTPTRTTHNTPLEVIWTIVPVIILVVIAVPVVPAACSSKPTCRKPDLTIKAIGKQWFWSYAYPDNGNFEFNSLMVQTKDLKPGQPRLLSVDNRSGRAGEQGGACAGDRRRRHPLLGRAVVRRADRRRSRPHERDLVQGHQDRDVLRPVLGAVRQAITPSCRSRCRW